MLSVKQEGIKHYFLSLWYDSTWNRTPIPRIIWWTIRPLCQWVAPCLSICFSPKKRRIYTNISIAFTSRSKLRNRNNPIIYALKHILIRTLLWSILPCFKVLLWWSGKWDYRKLTHSPEHGDFFFFFFLDLTNIGVKGVLDRQIVC